MQGNDNMWKIITKSPCSIAFRRIIQRIDISIWLSISQEALAIEEQLSEQKDAELRQVQKELETLLQECKTHIQALKEEKEHSRIQV